MFHDNLSSLRKFHKMNQETLAEKLGISRQTLSKWETGEALPDIEKAKQLAEIFDVSVDELLSFDSNRFGLMTPPKGKHLFGVVKIGEKGQIIIPAKARKVFNIQPGDELVVLGDEASGLAIIKAEHFLHLADMIRSNM